MEASFDLYRRRMRVQRDVSNQVLLPHYWVNGLDLTLDPSKGVWLPGVLRWVVVVGQTEENAHPITAIFDHSTMLGYIVQTLRPEIWTVVVGIRLVFAGYRLSGL